MTKPRVSDEAVQRATGRGWAEWCRLLDAEGARDLAHQEIATLVHEKFNTAPWWSQTVTVGYEQIRGLRVLHQKGKAFEISRSKTIAAPIARVYRAWTSAAERKRWLIDPGIAVTKVNANRSVRFGWVDGKTRAEAYFRGQGRQDCSDRCALQARERESGGEDEGVLVSDQRSVISDQ